MLQMIQPGLTKTLVRSGSSEKCAMANLILILPFWPGLLRAPKRSLVLFREAIWRRKGLSILGRTSNFLISYVRSNFFSCCNRFSVFKIHSKIMQSCSYTITTIENDPALFFFFLGFLVSAWTFMQPAPQIRWHLPGLNLTWVYF